MRWVGDLRFEGGGPGRPAILVDGNSKAATSPVELLVLSAATCAAADVVSILQKQRVELAALEVQAVSTRRETHPRRLTALTLHFTVRGSGADPDKARRAVDLSVGKYCSVLSSLAPDIPVTYDVTVA